MLTNEEKRIKSYSIESKPTRPSTVTPNTPLESLNLNWREKELPEKKRTKHVHRLHPYLGKYIPQLTEIFLRKYFNPGQTVLDPFCGSGTTLVQAHELGINSIGYDISAFNILLCKVKTKQYNIRKLEHEISDILEKTRTTVNSNLGQFSLWDKTVASLAETDSEYLWEWFAPQTLNELFTYRSFIESEEYEYKDLFKIILSRSARSARLTTHFDLDFPKQPQTTPYWCYKHSRDCTPVQEAFKFLQRYSIDTLRRIKEFSALETNAETIIRHADCLKASFPPHDGVITSPPYVGLIDYHEQHTYAYHLLDLKDKREHEIGPATNGSGLKAKEKYKADITEIFKRAMNSMPSGRPLIVIANDKHNIYPEIAKSLGVVMEGMVKRHVNRRTGRRAGEFYETIFVWKKP